MAAYDIRQARERRDRDEPHGARPGVGFVGAHGRLLRVRVGDHRRSHVRVRCPDCGDHHSTAEAMARPLAPDEAPPELVEIEPAADNPTPQRSEPAAPAKPPASQRILDAAILAALSRDEDRPAPKVAAALGYAGTDSLVRRVERMNAAAGSTLIHVRRDRRPTTLRLA